MAAPRIAKRIHIDLCAMYNPKLHFHFTGIGGSGMSGIAEILLNLGFRVSGSDQKKSAVTARLERIGATIHIGHNAENLAPDASLLVYSSAVSQENPELVAAKNRPIPVIPRAAVLAELMRLKYGVGVSGSHGKTTTTTMIATILERGGLDPTVVIGGEVKSLGGGGARLGKSEYLVAETDESDRSFLLLKPTVAVVTNIDSEHLSAYTSLQELEESFERFVQAVPFYGLAILCVDDPRVSKIAQRCSGRKTTYGFSSDANLRAADVNFAPGGMTFSILLQGEKIADVKLPALGLHLVSNALAAFAVGLEFGLKPQVIADALSVYPGVGRRLEVCGELRGAIVVNDYAHHPTEIRATLAALRGAYAANLKRLHVVFQPHRYSRTRDCFNDFIDAFAQSDNLIVTDIYAAGEKPIDGINAQKLCEAIAHPKKRHLAELADCIKAIDAELQAGDVIAFLGAGSIGSMPEKLLHNT